MSKVDRSTNYGWYLSIKTNQRLYMTFSSSGSYAIQSHTNNIIPLNTWLHIVMVYNGSGKASGIKIYVNDTNMFLVNDFDNLGNRSISNSRSAFIGAMDGSGGKSGYYSGKIDEVVIYNYTLTSDEIAYRYNNYTGTESMGFGVENATIGYIQSIPISLNGTNWLSYSSIYELKDGNINFKILDGSNNVLCSALGDISSCAGITTPIKLYAQLTIPTNISASPEIDNYGVNWYLTTSEDVIRGSGEIHISNPICTLSDNTINDIALKVIQYMLALKDKLFGS
jgi:hypothetical protein